MRFATHVVGTIHPLWSLTSTKSFDCPEWRPGVTFGALVWDFLLKWQGWGVEDSCFLWPWCFTPFPFSLINFQFFLILFSIALISVLGRSSHVTWVRRMVVSIQSGSCWAEPWGVCSPRGKWACIIRNYIWIRVYESASCIVETSVGTQVGW